MSTRIDYMYRDGSNYKRTAFVVLAGEITDEERQQITDHLDDGEYFIPEQVGLPNPRDEWDSHYEDDHYWNELLEISVVDHPLTDHDLDIHEFVARFVATEWNEAEGDRSLQAFLAGTREGR